MTPGWLRGLGQTIFHDNWAGGGRCRGLDIWGGGPEGGSWGFTTLLSKRNLLSFAFAEFLLLPTTPIPKV